MRPSGALFRISLPLTLTTLHGILVRVENRVFVIPTSHVERVARVMANGIRTVENRETIPIDGEVVSLVRMDVVLEMNLSNRAPKASDSVPVVVLGSGNDRIAFAVDEVLHDEELLIKNLPPPLLRVRNIAGVTLSAAGKVIPILNVADLIKSARKAGNLVVARPATDASPRRADRKPKTSSSRKIPSPPGC